MGSLYEPNAAYWYLKEILLYYDFFRYICPLLELMNQTSFVGNNDERKKDIFIITFKLHNKNHDKV